MATGPINWRELIKEGEGYNGPYRPGYRSPNVPAQEPMSAPVSEAGGKIVPSGDTSGLYAIYGRKNPHAASADRYSRMSGMDMGGRLGQLPGIAATFMAGRAEKKSAEFEQAKQKQIDDFMTRKEEHDRIQNDWEAKKRGVEIFQKEVIPMMEQAWDQKYAETKDPEAAGKYAASVGNDESTKSKLGTPLLLSYGKWQGETARTAVWRGSTGEISQGVVNKKGELGVLVKKGGKIVTVPADDKDMIFGDYIKLQDAKSRETKSMKGGLRDYDLAELGKQLDSLRKLKIEDTLSDAEQAQYEAIQAEYNRKAGIVIPEKPIEAPAAPAPAAPTPGVMGRIKNVFTGELGGPDQPQAAAPQGQPQPAQQGLIRRASGGRIALFDPSTKEFVRWE